MDEDGDYSTGDFILTEDSMSVITITPAIGFNEGGFGDNGFGGEDAVVIISSGTTSWTDDAEGLDTFTDIVDSGTAWTDIETP